MFRDLLPYLLLGVLAGVICLSLGNAIDKEIVFEKTIVNQYK